MPGVAPQGRRDPAWVGVANGAEGQVLAPDGSPLGGARVSARDALGAPCGETRAGADGRFRLELPASEGLAGFQLEGEAPWQDGVARGRARIRAGLVEGIRLETEAGYDLRLSFDRALRGQVGWANPEDPRPRELRTLAQSTREQVLAGLPAGPLWVGLIGLDDAGGWYWAQASGELGPGRASEWSLTCRPLREVRVQVRLGDAPQAAALQVLPRDLAARRLLAFGVLRWSDAHPFAEHPPELPVEGQATDAEGVLGLRLPAGRWAVLACGPAGLGRGQAELAVPEAPGAPLPLEVQLAAGASCELSVAGDRRGELRLELPVGACVWARGGGRYEVGGLRREDRVRVLALIADPRDEQAALAGAATLAPGERRELELVPTARLRVRVAPQGEPLTLTVRDALAGPAGEQEGRVVDLELEPGREADPEPIWGSPPSAASLSNFERTLGREALGIASTLDLIELGHLFPGAATLTRTRGELSESRSIELRAGELLELDWR